MITESACQELMDGVTAFVRTGKHLGAKLLPQWGVPVHSSTAALLGPIESAGAIRLTALAGCFQVDASVISRQVAELQKTGLVQRVPDPEDGRASLISLTDEGRAQLDRYRDLRTEWFRKALADWTDADAVTLSTLITRLSDDVAAAVAEHAPSVHQPA